MAGRALAAVLRDRGAPLTLGMVFPFSNHNFDLRYWLAAAGVHPDRDVRLVAIPPPLMVESLQAGLVDGFCVGEPWNTLAVTHGVGRIVVTQSQLFPRAVEKAPALRASFAEQADVLERLLQALDAAAKWVDDASNHSGLAALLARSEYLGVPPESIAAALDGRLHLGLGAAKRDVDFMYFHRTRQTLRAQPMGSGFMRRWFVGGSSPRAHRRNAPRPKSSAPIFIVRVCRRRLSQCRHRSRSTASSSSRPTYAPISASSPCKRHLQIFTLSEHPVLHRLKASWRANEPLWRSERASRPGGLVHPIAITI